MDLTFETRANVETDHHVGAIALASQLHGGVANHLEHVVDVAFDVGEHGVGFTRQSGLTDHVDRLRHVRGLFRACAGGGDGDCGKRVDIRFAGFRVDRHFLLFHIAIKDP